MHVCMLSSRRQNCAQLQGVRKQGDATQSVLLLVQITFLRQCRTANLTAEAYQSGGWSETYLGEDVTSFDMLFKAR